MLSINGKKFMNISEAVQWLLDNNALPFQSTASFAPDTEIAKSTIINPSPAEIKIGSLVLFADGKVGTVSGITSNGFKVSQDATDLSDGVPHVTNIQIDASNHLIFTMSEGDPIDAGLVKEVSGFSIDASQHLIVSYNDGTTQDLGAIFQGNVNIAGNFTANSIIENMNGYTFAVSQYLPSQITFTPIYASACKNGNKLTLVVFGTMVRTGTVSPGTGSTVNFIIPASVGSKIYPYTIGSDSVVANKTTEACVDIYNTDDKELSYAYLKYGDTVLTLFVPSGSYNSLTLNSTYVVRFENTFLLSDNMAN